MEGLYPIIRRVRRPLLSGVADVALPASAIADRADAASAIVVDAVPEKSAASDARAAARRRSGKEKAE
jgi:hypothetical protein